LSLFFDEGWLVLGYEGMHWVMRNSRLKYSNVILKPVAN
jgi:hypothetical protein